MQLLGSAFSVLSGKQEPALLRSLASGRGGGDAEDCLGWKAWKELEDGQPGQVQA